MVDEEPTIKECISTDGREYIITIKTILRVIQFRMPIHVLHNINTFGEDCSVTITRGANDE